MNDISGFVKLIYYKGRSLGSHLVYQLMSATDPEKALNEFFLSSRLFEKPDDDFRDAALQGIEDALVEERQYLGACFLTWIRARPGTVSRIQIYQEMARHTVGNSQVDAIEHFLGQIKPHTSRERKSSW